MKTFLVPSAIAALVSTVFLLGAEVPMHPDKAFNIPVDPARTPEGLSASDWSGIRGAYERNRHAIVVNPDGTYQARNPGQAWLTRFDTRGFTVTPDAAGWSWGLELVGYGDVTEIRQDGRKISYGRGNGLTEWFINDNRGLEQGWTLAKRPDGSDASGPLRLHLAVRGNLRPEVSQDGASMSFLSEGGGAVLTYGGLKAWDADGNTIHAKFEEGDAGGMELCVMVDDTDARYPITIDPIAQQAYFKASNTGAGDCFGHSVAVSGDTVVVGAYGEDSSATGVNGNQADNSTVDSGAAYVFVRNGDSWSQQAYLKASNTGSGDNFGYVVAVSGDTLVVGAYHEDSNATGANASQSSNAATNAGAAYVFVRSGTNWTQQAYLKASNTEASDRFGLSVAVSGDTVVVGADLEDSSTTGVNGSDSSNAATNSGAAYVFVRTGSAWTQQAYLKASNTEGADGFGYWVGISGETVVVGAPWEASSAIGVNGNQADNLAPLSGAAYVFIRSGTMWTQQAYLKASNTGADDHFGNSVGVSNETVVVGAGWEASSATGVNGDQTDNSAGYAGAAYVFVRGGTTWTQQAYLKASNTDAGDGFGTFVAISGNTVVAGSAWEASNTTGVDGIQTDNSAGNAGAAYVFVRGGTTWTQQAYLKASNTGANDYFGRSVAVSGNTVVIGADSEDGSATGVNGNQDEDTAVDSGAAYVYALPVSFTLSTAAVHGVINGTNGTGVYESGTTATLTVTADPGYLFTGWSGNAGGTTNPLSVLMDADRTITANFTPDTNDGDDDGLTNYQEILEYGTDPTKQDTDGDGVKDGGDALPLDPAETLDTDNDGIGDNADTDDDGDGLSDADEVNTYGTDPKLADTDGDGLSDCDEVIAYHTNPLVPDSDNDGLDDGAEVARGTNPKVGDSDGDGFLDGYEVLTGHSPLAALDKPALVAEARTAIEYTFPAALGKTYRIEGSVDLVTWTIVETGIAGNGAFIQRFYSTRDMPQRYFRVEEAAQ